MSSEVLQGGLSRSETERVLDKLPQLETAWDDTGCVTQRTGVTERLRSRVCTQLSVSKPVMLG